MLLQYLFTKNNNLSLLNSYIKQILIVLSFLSLYLIKPYPNKILTDQGLHEFSLMNRKIYTDYKDMNFFDFRKKEFKIGSDSPPKTILINGLLKDLPHLLTLYSTLKNANFLYRSIIIRVQTKDFFTKYKKLFYKKGKRNLYDFYYKKYNLINYKHKEGNFLKRNIKNYFVILNVSFTKESFLIINTLKNHQPNSDLLFLGQYYFPSKVKFFCKELFLNNFDINELQIEVQESIDGFSKLTSYIRCINNLHSHSLGNYFYVPFSNCHFSFLNIFPFILFTFLNCFMEYLLSQENDSIDFLMIMQSLIYLICPVSFLISFLQFKNENSKKAFFVIYYSIVNFKTGFLYAIFIFITNIIFLLRKHLCKIKS